MSLVRAYNRVEDEIQDLLQAIQASAGEDFIKKTAFESNDKHFRLQHRLEVRFCR